MIKMVDAIDVMIIAIEEVATTTTSVVDNESSGVSHGRASS
jgi:hypothetical protein